MQQTSRGKFNRLPRATAGFTTSALDGYGLRCQLPACPTPYASYPVLVHRLALLLHAAFRNHLAMIPWRFAITSPPSGCEEDFHLPAVEHARHTKKARSEDRARSSPWESRFYIRRRRTTPTTPIKPVPIISSVPGSGISVSETKVSTVLPWISSKSIESLPCCLGLHRLRD